MSAFFVWLGRLFVIAAVTMAVAYYVPLYRAHRALLAEQAQLREKTQGLDKELAGVRAELATLKGERDASDAKSQRQQEETAAAKSKVDDAVAALRFKLKRLLDRKLIALEARGDRATLSFSPGVSLGIEALPAPTVAARLSLCDIATAVSSVQNGVEVVAYVVPPAPGAAPPDDANASKWDVPMRRASRVADALETKCRLEPGHTTTVVHGGPSPTNSGLEISISLR